MSQTYEQIWGLLTKTNYRGDLWIFADEVNVNVILFEEKNPNQDAWQQKISALFAKTNFVPVFSSAWFVSL